MKLRINYTKVINQANSISDNADQLNAQIKALNQLEQECRACWKGDAADEFIKKLGQLRNEMTKTKTQIDKLASTIKSTADKIHKADLEQEEKAKALK